MRIARSFRFLFVAATCYPLVGSLAHTAGALAPVQALSSIRAGDVHFSPDGKTLAYVVTSYAWDARPRIRLLDPATGVETELTPAGKAERNPQWSPDGAQLGFLSTRGGKAQVYAASRDGTNAVALTARKAGVERFHWSPDGRRIAYLARADDMPSADAPRVADDVRALPHLWIQDLAAGTARSLGPAGWRIDDFQWQDSGHLIVAATSTPRVEADTDSLYRLSIGDGAVARVAAPPQPFDSLTLSPDGKRVAIRSTLVRGPVARDLLIGAVKDGRLARPWPEPDLGILQFRWRDGDGLFARVGDGFYNRLYRFPTRGAPRRIDLAQSVDGFDVAANGDIAFVGEDFGHLPELFVRSRNGIVRQLTHLSRSFAGGPLAPTSIFWTRSFDGTAIESALMTPLQADAASKAPLVLLVHGGPSSNFTAGFSWEAAWAQMLAARGYQVLMVNPRGSSGYGESFLEANRADWGGGDYKDLIAVLDSVIARGEVDPSRLGIGGWSYGGEMAAWAITRDHRFKAAVAGAPVYDQQAEFETESDGGSDEWWFGTPWEHPDLYARNSPATYIARAATPTLILDGELDESNPVGQSRGLYRALKHLGVETELVVYPGEGHSPRSLANNIDMFERILAWYDRQLKAGPSAM